MGKNTEAAKAQKAAIEAEELRKVAEAENRAALDSLLAAQASAVETAVEGERDSSTAVTATTAATTAGRGRPSAYTEDEADVICTWIAEGKSLKSYCRASGRPMMTVYRWLREYADFRDRYARAHEDRADTLADELVDIADSVAAGSLEEIQAARLRVDTRKWIAAKLRPGRWGEQKDTGPKTNVTFNIGIPNRQAAIAHSTAHTIDAEPLPALEQQADH
jgi:hypothetical protein